VDLVIANSRAGAAYNQRVFGLPASKYRVVHNGVDVERFHPCDASTVRQELGIAPNEPTFGMFASYKKQKNHPLLFAAATIVFERMPQSRLLLVGDELHAGMHGSGAYKGEMNRLVDDLGIRGRCIFAGNRNSVVPLYNACDVTVLPSFYEGTPNVLLESMACEVPVIATNVADNAYIVPDGRVGYIVPLGDPGALADRIHRLLADARLRGTMGREARLWVTQEFSTAQLAHKMGRVYQEAFDGLRRT
jgi:glycosyltransferase involved in cell wall biosynthesis